MNPCIYMHGASSHEVCCFELLWNVAPYLYPVHLSLRPCTFVVSYPRALNPLISNDMTEVLNEVFEVWNDFVNVPNDLSETSSDVFDRRNAETFVLKNRRFGNAKTSGGFRDSKSVEEQRVWNSRGHFFPL